MSLQTIIQEVPETDSLNNANEGIKSHNIEKPRKISLLSLSPWSTSNSEENLDFETKISELIRKPRTISSLSSSPSSPSSPPNNQTNLLRKNDFETKVSTLIENNLKKKKIDIRVNLIQRHLELVDLISINDVF